MLTFVRTRHPEVKHSQNSICRAWWESSEPSQIIVRSRRDLWTGVH